MRRLQVNLGILLLFTSALGFAQGRGSVQGSLHDLSVRGKGEVKSTTETEVCLFCHASHIVSTTSNIPNRAIWNQQLSSVASYGQYASSTFKQPNSTISVRSKLCLSCHDGTVAIGQRYSSASHAQQGKPDKHTPLASRMPADQTLGRDLSKDHPFGFQMPALDDGEIRLSLTTSPPATADAAVKLADDKIECITCHEPHTPNNDSSVEFMARSNAAGALCTACHDTSRGVLAGWPTSNHATSANAVSARSHLPYSTVATNACASCHSTHNGKHSSGDRLLRGEDEVCMNCHGDNSVITPSLPSIAAELRKTYSHPAGMQISPPHDPAESLPVNSSRHAECVDCHNPHATKSNGVFENPPRIQQSQAGVSGISASGNVLAVAVNQYEVCFKCHADSRNKPQERNYSLYGREPVRATFSSDPYNLRLDFSSPTARHNVTQAARPGVSPSLRDNMLDRYGVPKGRSLTTTAYLYCTDCHSDNAVQSSSESPVGPHGSQWPHLLERAYQQNSLPVQGAGGSLNPIPYTPGISGPYALCDKCHDLDSKLNLSGAGTDLAFGKHYSHVVNHGVSCSVCHAAHGIQDGSSANNKHMVNFDVDIVRPYGTNAVPYVDTMRRQCFLSCHGVTHNGTPY